jgi:uncharacterized protein YegL
MGDPTPRASRLTSKVSYAPRRLPIFIIADVGGGMGDRLRPGDGKLHLVNKSARDLIAALVGNRNPWEVTVAGIECRDGQAVLSLPLTRAAEAHWPEMAAAGSSSLGPALHLVRMIIEDETIITARDFRPVIILISAGTPNDNWVPELDALDMSPRAQKADRFAIAIGADADTAVLDLFIAPALRDSEAVAKRFDAGSEQAIADALKVITMSVFAHGSSRSVFTPGTSHI